MPIDYSKIPHVVPPHGPLDAKIAIVGEAPGKDEHAHKIPFCGASGELLNQMLAKAGIHRKIVKRFEQNRGMIFDAMSSVYTTNVVKVMPPDFAKTYYSDSKALIPNDALLKWRQLLAKELKECGANVIVAVGEHSLRSLTGKHGITKFRGSILESTLVPGRKVIPMIHPAHVLREYGFKPYCEMDLKRIAEDSKFPELRLPERDFVIRPTIDDVLFFARRLTETEWCSVDIETKYNNIACIGFSDRPNWAICIPFIASGRAYWPNAAVEAAAWNVVNQILTSPSKKVLQNALFDLTHLWCHGIRVKNVFHDTMLAQNILYPELAKGLDVLTSIYTREPYYKSDGRALLSKKSEKTWDPKQSDDDLWIYNCKDASVTLEVCFEQIKEF